MKRTSSTRSSKVKTENDAVETARITKAHALLKVFYLAKNLLANEVSSAKALKMQRFYHPGKAQIALFITCCHDNDVEHSSIMEIMEFAEPRRSWLVNDEVSSNGSLYLTTPIDVTFLALHQIRKHCTQKALSLDSICVEQEDDKLLTKYANVQALHCIADVKTAKGTDMTFYKYNAEKTLAWLALKTKRLMLTLKAVGVHCGQSALSQNYARSNKATDELITDDDYLRMACDIVGGYVDLDLYEQLTTYLAIPALKVPNTAAVEQKTALKKRKSLQALNAADNKKQKLDAVADGNSAAAKLSKSGLLDESADSKQLNVTAEDLKSPPVIATPLKERVLTKKEQALAKSAKGTKSISSFFKK